MPNSRRHHGRPQAVNSTSMIGRSSIEQVIRVPFALNWEVEGVRRHYKGARIDRQIFAE